MDMSHVRWCTDTKLTCLQNALEELKVVPNILQTIFVNDVILAEALILTYCPVLLSPYRDEKMIDCLKGKSSKSQTFC